MYDLEVVEISHARHDIRKLNVLHEKKEQEIVSGLTNCKRFAAGLDCVYFTIFPLCVHSVRMRKRCGPPEIETPTRGKMFG